MPKDSKNNSYIETPMGNGEFIRVTHVKNGWPGCDTIRVQVRDQSGHLRFGPEFPNKIIEDFVKSIQVVSNGNAEK